MKNTTYDFIIFHIKEKVNVKNIIEIRHVKVLKKNKLRAAQSAYKLIFMSNDFVEFKESGLKESILEYYIIKTHKKVYLIGFELDFLNNGLKQEKIIKFHEINKFHSFLLSSKFDQIIYSSR